ncbi:AraC family transcriptional regulator [Salipiger abyssi]|uniref:AraC family transcriptional regulator n=1 Tax=Salipiger abyssi TaxID=1250539 RepID=UPI001A8F1D87|nr:AraC family transcriptional regulator [Salipiger abyssi]MBN9888848.1 AraC family transcriptional regulator [Salipiger abyssi]
MRQGYEDRIRRVLQYIHDHPDGDLSLDALAEVAAMSRFHWHRVFRGMTGETLAQAVRRVRAYRAACWLTATDWPVERIAGQAGYGNVQSFSRSFREIYGMTPAAYRKAGDPGAVQLLLREGGHDMHPVDIRTLSPLRLAALDHRGAYITIGACFDQVSAVFSARGLWPQAQGMVGVYYDDPGAVAEAELRSAAGIAVGDAFAMPEDLKELRLPGGRHAVLTFRGPYSELHSAYDYLYGEWLPQSGQEVADAPPFERYLNSPAEVVPSELITEICAPLAPAE